MTQHRGHTSSAVKLLLGGGLAAALGGASVAWACTPVAVTIAMFASVDQPATDGGEIVTVKGNTYTHEVVDGSQYKDLDTPGPTYTPVKVQIREGLATEESLAGPLVQEVSGPSYETTLKLAGPGYYPFTAFAVNREGHLVRPVNFMYKVVAPAAKTAPEIEAPVPATPTPAPPQLNTVPADPAPTPTPAATPTPAVKPAAATSSKAPAVTSRPSAAATAPAGAARSSLPAASNSSSTGASVAPTLVAPTPMSAADVLTPLPAQSNLWNGLDPSAGAASLVNGSGTAPSGGGFPVGGALLGIGVLGLAGAGAITARRKVAVSRTSRS